RRALRHRVLPRASRHGRNALDGAVGLPRRFSVLCHRSDAQNEVLMRYYVLTQTGERYGPADIETLQSWAQQGRIAAHTVLVEAETGAQLRADQLDDLQPAFLPPRYPTAEGNRPPHARPCPNCGQPVVLGATLCEHCGASLSRTPAGRY